ncbi:MAG: hypothetical protein JWQ42_1146 [Edaphobacter sp.]|nr:hypothetical protein [Edaphobacter sp.]
MNTYADACHIGHNTCYLDWRKIRTKTFDQPEYM